MNRNGARVDLAAAYRLVALLKWDDLVYTHISARVPGAPDQFLINPDGLMFEEITASSLVKVDLEGNKVEDSPYPVNPAGFTIHSAIRAARHDVECVLHTHSLNGVAVSAQQEGVLPLSQQSIFVAMYFFEAVCAIQVRAMAGGTPLTHVHPDIITTARQPPSGVSRSARTNKSRRTGPPHSW